MCWQFFLHPQEKRWGVITYLCLNSWWRHQMETFPRFLSFVRWNSPVIGEFSSQRPVTRSFGVSLICSWTNSGLNFSNRFGTYVRDKLSCGPFLDDNHQVDGHPKKRRRTQFWVIKRDFPGWFIALPQFCVKTQLWGVHSNLRRDDYHPKMGHNWAHPSHMSDALKIEGKAKNLLLSPKHSHHKTLFVVLYVMFTKCSIIWIKNSSVLLLDNICVVAVMYFSAASPDFWKWVASCTCHIIDWFFITFRLSPSFRRLSNIKFMISTLYCIFSIALSIYSRWANQSKKILCITLSRVLVDHRLKLLIAD